MSADLIDSLLGDDVDLGPLINNHEQVKSLQYAVSKAPQDLDLLRSSLALCVRGDAWARRYNPHTRQFLVFGWEPADDRDARREQFLRFVSEPPERGLGTTVGTLMRLLEGTQEYFTVVEMASQGRGNPTGANQYTTQRDEEPVGNHDIVMVSSDAQPKKLKRLDAPEQGNSVPYAVRRLARQRPDLLDKVKAGELSAHAAMVEAGFRKVPTPLDVLRRAWAKATPAERAQFLKEVS